MEDLTVNGLNMKMLDDSNANHIKSSYNLYLLFRMYQSKP